MLSLHHVHRKYKFVDGFLDLSFRCLRGVSGWLSCVCVRADIQFVVRLTDTTVHTLWAPKYFYVI